MEEIYADKIHRIMSNRYNYTKISNLARELFQRRNHDLNISKKCKVTFSPFKAIVYDLSNELPVERYFDVEILYAGLPLFNALVFKTCFAVSLQILYNTQKLNVGYDC